VNAVDVILVGCTKAKRTERSAARDLYDASDLFRRRRAYAEATGLPWGILSALAGAVSPTTVLDPYDYTIAQRRKADADTRGWAIGAIQGAFRLAGRVDELGLVDTSRPLVIEVHAGIDYVRTLELALPAFSTTIELVHPVAGLMIGEQKQHYAGLVSEPAEIPSTFGQLALAL
jgi:hypothetical protein